MGGADTHVLAEWSVNGPNHHNPAEAGDFHIWMEIHQQAGAFTRWGMGGRQTPQDMLSVPLTKLVSLFLPAFSTPPTFQVMGGA